jgi:hypothetical protein
MDYHPFKKKCVVKCNPTFSSRNEETFRCVRKKAAKVTQKIKPKKLKNGNPPKAKAKAKAKATPKAKAKAKPSTKKQKSKN